MDRDLEGRVMVVTGANAGIGLETAKNFACRGARVLMTARSREKGEAAREIVKRVSNRDAVELVVFDLASLASVRAGAAEIARLTDRIDVLVNNAGLILSKRQLTVDGFEATLGINHLGPFLLTHLLLDRVKAGKAKRIVNVASRAHTRCFGLWFDDLMVAKKRYFGMQVYSHSKLANIAFTVELAKRLAPSGITVNSLHPGVVRTGFGKEGDLGGFFGFSWRLIGPLLLSPEDGARTSIHCATSPEVEGVTGKYFDECKEKLPSRAARDEAAASRLFAISADLVGLSA